MSPKRKYIKFEPNRKQGYPAGKNIYYECLICGVIVESRPEHFAECKCQNITVDIAGGRLSITGPTKFKIFKGKAHRKDLRILLFLPSAEGEN